MITDRMKIMVIEDDIDLSELIKMYLLPENYIVETFNRGNDAIEAFKKGRYDIILLDLLLPDINGFEICKIIREKSTIPIIMLTALEDSVHRVQGLNMGADDYIVKPFEPGELIARIKSQLRRTYEFALPIEEANSHERTVGKLSLDRKKHKAYYDNEIIDLTKKEFEILWMLMKEPDRVYNMEEIYYKIWGDKVLESEVNPVMVHIRRIRIKFEKIKVNQVIKTVWGVGYKINV